MKFFPQQHKIIITAVALIILAFALLNVPKAEAARTSTIWQERLSTYIETTWNEGRNVLINGVNKYLNFGSLSGTSGYGFRDNGGDIEFKNEGGSWAGIGSGGSSFGTTTQIPFTNAGGTDFDYSSGLTFDGTDFAINTNHLFVKGSTGNVGIGTSIPAGTGSTTLQVAGTGGGSTQYGSLTLSNASGNTGAIGGSVDFYNSGILTSSIQSVVTSPGSSNDLYFSTKNSTVTEKMRITSDGKVGIGTTTPNEQLEITKNFRLPASTATTGIIYKGASRYIHDYGTQSVFMGIDAGNLTNTGLWNTGVGYNALKALTTGNYNNAIGHGAGIALTQGQFNNAMGRNSLGSLTTGSSNSAVGNSALGSITTQDANTGVGTSAGFATTGAGNVFIGANTGQSLTTATNGTYIGYQAGLSGTSGLSYAVAVGALAQVTTSNTMALGGTGVSATNVIIGGTTASAKLHVIKTTEQLRVGYDASNYWSATVGSTGITTIDATGANASFNFSKNIGIGAQNTGTVGIIISSSNDEKFRLTSTTAGTPANYLTFYDTRGRTSGFGHASGGNDHFTAWNDTSAGDFIFSTNGAGNQTLSARAGGGVAIRAHSGQTQNLLEIRQNSGSTVLSAFDVSGKLGVGTGSTISANLHSLSTTEQLRLGYDASNYLSATVGSTGSVTFGLTGTSPEFTFSQAVNVPDEVYGVGWDSSTEVPTKNAIYDKIESFDIVVVKSADETVNNSSTLQNDDELLFSVGANEFWAVTLVVLYDTGTTPDLKLQMSVPTGATALLSNGAFYDSLFFTESVKLNTFGLGIDGIAVFQGYVKTSGTAGSAVLQWAQNTADMSDTKVLANSYLIARKLE